jgi:hypothetical protein
MRVTCQIAGMALIIAILMIMPAATAAQTETDTEHQPKVVDFLPLTADRDQSSVVTFLPYTTDLLNSTSAPGELEIQAKSWHLVKSVSHYMVGTGDVKTWPRYHANRAGKTQIIMLGPEPISAYFTLYVLYRGKWYKSPVPGNYAIAQMYMRKGEPYRLKVKSNSGSGLASINVYRYY